MRKTALIFIEDNTFTNDNRVIREANALVEAGWRVTVICPKYPGDPFYQKVNDQLRVYFYLKPNAVSSIGHIIEHSLTLFFGVFLVAWVKLRHGFKIFHACNPTDTLWLLAAPYKPLGVKYVFDQHDLCPELYLSWGKSSDSGFYKLLMFLERMSYRMANAVISTNESYKSIATSRGGCAEDKVFVVRNGPNLKKFRPVEPRRGLKKESETLVGYLGSMNVHDGVDRLLIAADYVRNKVRREDIRFILVGGGSYQPSLVRQAQDMGLQDFVTFTGRVSDDDMLTNLCACDLCVQPDPCNPLNNLSTMNKVMEYMALKKPVVAYDLKETRYSCGDAALYADPHDPEDLGRKIIELADDPERQKEMAQVGRTRIEDVLAWPYSVPHLLEAYDFATR